MAVQKSRKSKSKRNMRRSSNSVFVLPTMSLDKETGEFHLRHFITKSGYYKGKQVFKKLRIKKNKKEDLTEKNLE
ncbi:MAG TPA: 50S ribosomal protein L32 [Candidatus Azoamicus sp.]